MYVYTAKYTVSDYRPDRAGRHRGPARGEGVTLLLRRRSETLLPLEVSVAWSGSQRRSLFGDMSARAQNATLTDRLTG